MGGYYSGRWHWYTKKTTVEECHRISVRDFNKGLLNRRYAETRIVYESETDNAKLARVFAKYAVDRLLDKAGREKPHRPAQTGQQFKLTRTPCNYGGWRYWLLCPTCGRRCGKLYKPYYGWRYACRGCHDLTYTSAQEAHEYDRSKGIGHLARNLDLFARAELVQRKIDRAHIGSKRWRRLLERHDQIMNQLLPFDT